MASELDLHPDRPVVIDETWHGSTRLAAAASGRCRRSPWPLEKNSLCRALTPRDSIASLLPDGPLSAKPSRPMSTRCSYLQRSFVVEAVRATSMMRGSISLAGRAKVSAQTDPSEHQRPNHSPVSAIEARRGRRASGSDKSPPGSDTRQSSPITAFRKRAAIGRSAGPADPTPALNGSAHANGIL